MLNTYRNAALAEQESIETMEKTAMAVEAAIIEDIMAQEALGLVALELNTTDNAENASHASKAAEKLSEAKKAALEAAGKLAAAKKAEAKAIKAAEKAAKAVHAEAFEIAEYGRQPSEEEIRKLFPMLGQ